MGPHSDRAAESRFRFFEALTNASFKRIDSLIAVLRAGLKADDPAARVICVGGAAAIAICFLLFVVVVVHIVVAAISKGPVVQVPIQTYFICIAIVGSLIIMEAIAAAAYIGNRAAARALDQSYSRIESARARQRRPRSDQKASDVRKVGNGA